MLGFFEKQTKVLGISGQETQIVGYKLIFKHFDESIKVNEIDYFKTCRSKCQIVFKEEPTKSVSQSFENSGYCLLKGRNWNFFMAKLYCIIGRSPINYKNRNVEVKTVWHVDVDLGHLRKVSRQHALIAFNFEKETFEIKCLSKKYPVTVDKTQLTFSDAALPLKSGQIIGISNESFFFLLPANPVVESLTKEKSEAKISE